MDGYGTLADHVPSILFLFVLVAFSFWVTFRTSRRPRVGIPPDVPRGQRDGRDRTAPPVSRSVRSRMAGTRVRPSPSPVRHGVTLTPDRDARDARRINHQ